MSDLPEMPHSDTAEWAVLASCIGSKIGAIDAVDTLRPDYFYRAANRAIFEAVVDLVRDEKPVDVLTLAEALRARGTFEDAGGYDALGAIVDGFGLHENVEHHAAIVKDRWALRQLAIEAERIRAGVEEKGAVGRDLLRSTEKRLGSIGEEVDGGFRKTVVFADAVRDAVRLMEERISNPDAHRGLYTGYGRLDRMMTGLRDGELGILAARPSMGKTALALGIVRNVAHRYGTPTAVISLEMSSPELSDRMLATEAAVPLQKLRTGKLYDEERRRIKEAAARISAAKILVDDSTSADVDDVRAAIRRLVRREGVGFVVIDYLQLLEARSARNDGRTAEVGYISRQLKHMARELNVPVLAVAQLSRGPEQRTNKRPLLSDLRESGSIEQDADFVWMLYRGEYYLSDEEKRKASPEVLTAAELIVQKQRNGPTGMVPLHFDKETTRFLERE